MLLQAILKYNNIISMLVQNCSATIMGRHGGSVAEWLGHQT